MAAGLHSEMNEKSDAGAPAAAVRSGILCGDGATIAHNVLRMAPLWELGRDREPLRITRPH